MNSGFGYADTGLALLVCHLDEDSKLRGQEGSLGLDQDTRGRGSVQNNMFRQKNLPQEMVLGCGAGFAWPERSHQPSKRDTRALAGCSG